MEKEKSIVLFNENRIRRVWDDKNELWYFAIVDIISILTESKNPQVYWRFLKKRLKDEGAIETVTKCNGLKMHAPDSLLKIFQVIRRFKHLFNRQTTNLSNT